MAQAKRKLAAILSADVAGYSRLMCRDDRATLETLKALRATMTRHVEAHDGRVVNTPGDALLAEFPSAVEAVQAAAEIQVNLAEQSAEVPEDRRMRVRIGINLGDVLVEPDGTLYGDGVNVAARMEGLAEPGGICVSGKVVEEVEGKTDLGFQDIGEHEVKNIARPVRTYRVVAGGDVGPTRRRRFRRRHKVLALAATLGLIPAIGIALWSAGWLGLGTTLVADAAQFRPSLPSGPTIAVLPFENLSGDPDQGYFSDGLTEDVIAALGRFSNLSVLARNATLRFKGQARPPEEIGRELGVGYLLEGSVRRAGSQIRVSAQLIDATTGQHLWSSRYDNEFEDLFSVQDDITRNVAGALAVELTRVESDRAADKPTENLEAYDYVLRGWDQLLLYERSANYRAREMFKRAIEIDPGYATAYVGLGDAFRLGVTSGYTEFIVRDLERAEALTRQALGLDPNSVGALRVLGYLYLQKGEYDLAASHLRSALEINPSDAHSYTGYGYVLLYSGHEQKAVEWLEAALLLDPNMVASDLASLAQAYYLSGRYGEAVATAHEALRRHPDHTVAYSILAAAYAQLGRAEMAARAAQDVLRTRPFFTIAWYTAAFADPDDAAHVADGLRKAGLDAAGAPPADD